MQILLDTTLERDIDLLIIEEFICEPKFAKIFIAAAGITDDYTIHTAIHSKIDADYGESDIVIILNLNGNLHALHIENKIDAIAMPNQSARYHLRAKKEIAKGEYQSYSVLIVAPAKYLEKNSEAQKYPFCVTYEQLRDYFKENADIRSQYKLALIERAITEQKSGYQWQANPHVVRFCTAMYNHQKEHYPGMSLGTVAWWPTFRTIHKDIYVAFKANKGHCDLSFNCSQEELYAKLKDKISGKMTIERTGKSSAVRIAVNPIKFEDNFEDVISDVDMALTAIKELIEFGNSL